MSAQEPHGGPANESRPLTLLTDYGLRDHTVGVLHGVMARIAPAARVIDISHAIPPGDVRAGAIMLRNALAQMPVGVHVAIVDPGVGGERRAVAIRCADDRLLVGPDNGLLHPAAQRHGTAAAIDIGDSPHRQEPVAPSFHGRDIFAPVAAHLAAGEPFERAGRPFDPGELVPLDILQPVVGDGRIEAKVVHVDNFGTLDLNVDADGLDRAGFQRGDRVRLIAAGCPSEATVCRAFGDVAEGELLVYVNPDGAVAVAVNRGSAAERLGTGADASIELRISRT